MSDPTIPVAVHGWTYASGLMAVLNLLVGGLLVTIIRTRPALKKIANEREANLLSERAEEMSLMRRQLAKLEAERARDRHRINNLSQCLDALLMMIEMDPAKAKEAAARVKAMRTAQIGAEATEAAAIRAAEVQPVEKEGDA